MTFAVTNTFTNGTLADANQVNQNFTDIVGVVNNDLYNVVNSTTHKIKALNTTYLDSLAAGTLTGIQAIANAGVNGKASGSGAENKVMATYTSSANDFTTATTIEVVYNGYVSSSNNDCHIEVSVTDGTHTLTATTVAVTSGQTGTLSGRVTISQGLTNTNAFITLLGNGKNALDISSSQSASFNANWITGVVTITATFVFGTNGRGEGTAKIVVNR